MPDLGTKYECEECGTKFYDLGRPETCCPKCGKNPLGEDAPDAEEAEDKKEK